MISAVSLLQQKGYKSQSNVAQIAQNPKLNNDKSNVNFGSLGLILGVGLPILACVYGVIRFLTNFYKAYDPQ